MTSACERAIDLGSGGGLPGLVLASAWPGTAWYLVDSNRRRSEWLRSAVSALGLDRRCLVVCERAEDLGRSELRGTFDLVTARSFAPPAATAECAAPMLKPGGELVVSDPPNALGASRWPDAGLAILGLVRASTETVVTPAGPVTLSRVLATTSCQPRYPRRVGIPFKRPLF
jgi:16S rRNA (guanine527-N7)-methyltransferase